MRTVLLWCVIGLGGALGAVARYGLSTWIEFTVRNQALPWGIMACNVLGSFLVGLLAGLWMHRFDAGPLCRAFWIIGLLGGFTTFSSFSLDTVSLLLAGDVVRAVTHVLLTVMICIAATLIGFVLVGGVWR